MLKLIRAAQGIKSQIILCQNGLFIDAFSIYRCVADCAEEIIFMLEQYPEQSSHVKQFVNNFFEHTIDNYLSVETNPVLKQKVHSANIRYLTDMSFNEEIRNKLENIHKTFCERCQS